MRWERLGRISLLIVLGVVGLLYVQHAIAYISAREQDDQQKAIVQRLTRANATLAREERSLGNPATIERDARALGMVKPGERPYVVIGQPSH